jgi:hypothetical protein
MSSSLQAKRDSAEEKKYKPTEEQEALLAQVSSDWISAKTLKDTPWRHLRNKTIDDFMQMSRDHYNGYVEEPDSTDDEWKSRVFKKKTRNKVTAMIAGFLASGVGIDIAAKDLEERLDRAMSQVADDVYYWSLERENFDYKMMKVLLELIVTGTVHIYEDIVWDKRDVYEITDLDLETGETIYEKASRTTFKGCRAEFAPNSEMFVGDIWTHEIQEQPYVIRRKTTTYENAEEQMAKYPNWQYVKPGNDHYLDDSNESEERQTEEDTDDNSVEIVYYWNKSRDLYAIVVNGVLMTPVINPFPFTHKEYPFSKSVFELHADSRFYWGDSLPNKNWDEQEMVNELYRMFFDATKLKIKPPLFTTNAELGGTDLIVPGSIAVKEETDTIETIREITQGIGQSEFNVLSLAERQIDENSVDPLLTGQQPQGDPTATEVRAVVGSAERVQDYNDQFVGNLLIQHAHLRIKNILWFLTNDEDYRRVVLNDVKTKAGNNGNRQIKFIAAGELPTSADLLRAEEITEKKGEDVDFVFVNKDKVNDYRFHMSISTVKRVNRTHASRVSRVFSKYRLYAQNELIDQAVNTKRLVEALGDDPDEMVRQPQITQAPQQPGQTLQLPANSPQLDQSLTQQAPDLVV